MHSLAAVRSGTPSIPRATVRAGVVWLAQCLDAILKTRLHVGTDAPWPSAEAHVCLTAFRQPQAGRLLDELTRIMHDSLMPGLPTLLHAHTKVVLRFVVGAHHGCSADEIGKVGVPREFFDGR